MSNSLIPKITEGQVESMRWDKVPEGLKGTSVGSLDELKKIFPATKELSMVGLSSKKSSKLEVYVQRFTLPHFSFEVPVAYKCPSCGIIVGPPRYEDVNTISDEHPLSGSEGYKVYCVSCKQELDSHNSKNS